VKRFPGKFESIVQPVEALNLFFLGGIMGFHVYWFLLALILLGLEMATGTFYLLVISIAMAAGGTVAFRGGSLIWQLVLCALTVIAGVFILRYWKSGQVTKPASASLDIGQPVQVLKWHESGSARVFYRGAEWDAEPESADIPREAPLYIAAIRGSSLVLTNRKPQQN
jgi:membrane protein implicated in regulation of membrane protease activity